MSKIIPHLGKPIERFSNMLFKHVELEREIDFGAKAAERASRLE